MPREKRERIRAAHDIYDFMEQKLISRKNMERLEELCASSSEAIRHLASLVLQMARINPSRRKRRADIYHNHRALFDQLVSARLFEEWIPFDDDEIIDPADYADSEDGDVPESVHEGVPF